jgi:hypothetical protein
MNVVLIPCPPAGARAALDAVDETFATAAQLTATVRDVLALLRVAIVLGYIVKLGAWPGKN